MFNITNNYRNAYQRYEILPHTSKNGYHPKKKKIHKQQMLERVWREGNPPTLLVGV